MIGGRFRALTGFVRRDKEVLDGTGQALRDVMPLEAEADAAMKRCIDQLDNIEGVLERRLREGRDGKV